MAHDSLGFLHRFVAGSDTDPRTLLLLHGTGGTEEDLLSVGRSVAPGAALLSPRGKVLEHGMPRFFRRLAEGVFDQADLQQRTDELATFVTAACKAYGRDPACVVALGFSNGANIAASLMLQKPEVLRGAVLIRAMVPFEPAVLPTLVRKSVLMLSSKADPIVPVANSERLAELLKSAGAAVSLEWQLGGHGLTQSDLHAASRWLEQLAPSTISKRAGTI